ncbi:MAG: methyltransferase domain-containing protein [Kiritimatiellae bacterium]|nr:methyltransferase domain-containing protein [Kiritimatiellia bacterium]
MSNIKLSTRQDWINHWKKHDLVRLIPETFVYYDILKKTVSAVGCSGKSIELGGFPGSFSVYLKKYCNMDVTLLDYVIDQNIVIELFKANGLGNGDIKIIEADVFSYESKENYDFVCSFGFVEHFTDLEQVLRAHLKFMRPGGILLITLPNFKGVNGLVQKIFDPATLAIHNLKVMNPKLLRKTLSTLGLQDIQVEYYPSTSVWLEEFDRRNFIVRLITRIVNKLISLLAGICGRQSRWFSDSIIVIARKPSGL